LKEVDPIVIVMLLKYQGNWGLLSEQKEKYHV